MMRILRVGGTPVLLLATLLGLCCLPGCGAGGPGPAASGQLSDSDLEQAEQLFQRLTREHSLHRDNKTLAVADALLTQYPTYPRNDEVLFMAVESARGLDDNQRALDLTDQLVSRYPESARAPGALALGVEASLAAGDTLRAAGYHFELFERDPGGQTGPDGRPVAAPVLAALSLDQLNELSLRRPAGALQPYLGFLRVEKMLQDDRIAAAETVVQDLQTRAPDNAWTLAASDLLFGGSGAPGTDRASEVQPNQVGVVCPLTGRYALLGNAFYDAALLALEVTNDELGTAFELKVEDSEGDPVAGALAARRLCAQEGSIALLGALMSGPTATVALVADLWKVPLVSPTATNERIWELGGGIFQTNLTGLYETRLLASLATTVMLKKRFGLLYPDTPEGRGYAEVFRKEVEGWGGQIVAQAAFPAQTTDFKDPILALRRERPEVLFVPASVDQMVLLGPQLDFYHAGSLIMGLSNWNSEKLLEKSGALLERAVFPNDLALFPDHWTSEFRSRWNDENYPREATALALKSYQATRMLLDTMAGSEAASRLQLTHALRNRLANRDFDSEGPESFAGTVRMFRDQNIVPFPGGRFAEAWQLTEGAVADSASAAPGPEAVEGAGE
ncbi:MAG: ABC transporter substrate-binding protein [Candidatus Krumholzibacteriota bacterium]